VVVEVFSPALDSWTETRVFPLRRGGLGVYFRDITERRGLEQERERRLASERAARAAAEQAQLDLAHQVLHDDLTGLLNRAGLRHQVESYLALWPTTGLTVLLIDLDQFKLVNDSLGHGLGDRVLTAFAQRLGDLAGPTDLVGRFGGDAYVVIRFDDSPMAATQMAEAVIAAARQPIETCSRLTVTVSIGLARTIDEADLDDLMQQADAAVYQAKDAGRDQAVWFDERMHLESVQRLQTEHDLRQALERDELFLDYQPAFDLRCERISHVEALVRWRHPTRGLIPPLDFIPVAEDSGLVHQVGEWVLAHAVEQAARWAHIPDLRVWINVSPQQLAHRGLPDLIAAHLDRVGLPAAHLGIEVTESTLADRANLTQVLQEIRDLGVAIAIDDFGTGYSSLARLSVFPVDVIKIDQSFVADVQTARGEAVLAGIVTLAHATGAHVIAEGVETEAQLTALSALGVDSASGYLLARPAEPDHLPLPRATDPSAQGCAGLHPSLRKLLRELVAIN
jgi:diguanylate cyclase (GGDEF)-like protein